MMIQNTLKTNYKYDFIYYIMFAKPKGKFIPKEKSNDIEDITNEIEDIKNDLEDIKNDIEKSPKDAIDETYDNFGNNIVSIKEYIKHIFTPKKTIVIPSINTDECNKLTDEFIKCLHYNHSEMYTCEDVYKRFNECIQTKKED